MAQIFISYAHEDRERIQPLVRAIEKQGCSVFWDQCIPNGQTWRSYIGNALTNASCVIVAWSRFSIDSGWVSEEAEEGKSRGILIPVLLDSVQPPIGFRSIQAANLNDWQPERPSQVFEQLVKDINNIVLGGNSRSPATMQTVKVEPETHRQPSSSSPQRQVKFSSRRLTYALAVISAMFVGGCIWGYVKWLSTNLPGGSVVVFDAFKDPEKSGFNFATENLVPWHSGKADIGVSNTQPAWPQARLFAQNETGKFSRASQDKGANSGIQEIPKTRLEDVQECPASGYQVHWVIATANSIYCVRSRDGKHYAKIKLTAVEADRIAFDWIYQPNSSRRFQ